jgi:hypothetical protein
MTSTKAGSVMFWCPDTERNFDSGFVADKSELQAISSFAHLRARCPECGKLHELNFADGWIQARNPVPRVACVRA